MGPKILVPSLVVFGTLPKLPFITNIKPKQSKIFKALEKSRTEMETIVAESRIQRAFHSKL